jgi:hypothetical protein
MRWTYNQTTSGCTCSSAAGPGLCPLHRPMSGNVLTLAPRTERAVRCGRCGVRLLVRSDAEPLSYDRVLSVEPHQCPESHE